MRGLLALGLAVVALAGCLDPLPGGADPDGPGGDGPPRRDAFFTADMGLAPEMPADGAVRTGSFFASWAEGSDYETWRTPAFAATTNVSDLTVTLALRATGPVVTSGRFPDVMVYGGTGESWIGFASQREIAPVLTPLTVYNVELALALPQGGLIVPAGESLGLKVVPVMHQNDGADIEVLVGATGSRATWTEAPLAIGELQLAGETYAGQTTGSIYAGEQAPETTWHRQAIALEGEPRALLVWMNTTDAKGIPDIDLEVVGPDGVSIATAGTPTPREFIRLMGPNLRGAGEYTIVVSSAGSARADFDVTWLAG